ncbi:MAG: histidine kinase [Pseudomonadota bacterium]
MPSNTLAMRALFPKIRGPQGFILTATLGVWAAFYFFYTAMWVFEQGIPPDLAQRGFVFGASAGFTYWACLACFAALQNKRRGRWLLTFGLIILVVLAHSGFAGFVYKALPPNDWYANQTWEQLSLGALFYNTPIVTTAFFALVAVFFGHQSAAQERALLMSDLSARRAQLETLRYQLNPHFLFNTLNTISNIVLDDNGPEAERAIVLLSKFLRRSIDADPLVPIALSEEFQNTENYLDIERIRFEDRLSVQFDRDPDAEEWRVPPFLLQPILENVIKHAVAKVIRPVTVVVTSRAEDGFLHITVEDDGPGASLDRAGSQGLGLSATRERLQLTYGERASLDVRARHPTGFCVRIRVPYLKEELRVQSPHC